VGGGGGGGVRRKRSLQSPPAHLRPLRPQGVFAGSFLDSPTFYPLLP
jgi:hypothetical protein